MTPIPERSPPPPAVEAAALACLLHDLRQPVQAALLYTALLAARPRDAPDRALLDRLRVALEAVGRVLDTVPTAAAAERPPLGPVRLGSLLAALGAELQAQADARRVRLSVLRTGAVVASEPGLLARVARNLILNALLHSGGRRVVVGVRRGPAGAARLVVADDGRGIAAADLDTLFRVGGCFGPTAGAGLGLAGAAWAAGRLGHSLFVSSRPGRGSVFGVRIAAPAAGA